MYPQAHQIYPRSHLGHHTHSLMAHSAHWHTGTVLEHRSSEHKILDLHHHRLSSHLLRHTATPQVCTSYLYTETGFPGIGGHLQRQQLDLSEPKCLSKLSLLVILMKANIIMLLCLLRLSTTLK